MNRYFLLLIYLNDERRSFYHNKITICVAKEIDGDGEFYFPLDFYELEKSSFERLIDFISSKNFYFFVDDLKILTKMTSEIDLDRFKDAKDVLKKNGIDYERKKHKFFVESKYYPLSFITNEAREVEKKIKNIDYKNEFPKNDYEKFLSKMMMEFNLIEKNGIKINYEIFEKNLHDKKYLVNDNHFIFCDYRLNYDSMRPTNSFGGINFNALKKNSFLREMIISRYGSEGVLINFDYKSFHANLIKKIIGIDDDRDIYEEIAERIDGDSIEKRREEAKKIFFKMIYGYSNNDKSKKINIDILEKINDFKKKLAYKFSHDKRLLIPFSNKLIKIDEVAENKIFNYFLQCYETAYNSKKIMQINQFLKNKNACFILYNYDSFLFDAHISEKENIINEAKKILEKEGLKTKIKTGNNFSNLKDEI